MRRSLRHVRSTFLAGLVVVVPVIIVCRLGQYIVGYLAQVSYLQRLEVFLESLLGAFASSVVAMIATVLIGFLVIFVLGMLVTSRFTSKFFDTILAQLFTIPIAGPLLESFYQASRKLKQKLDADEDLFGECVLVRQDDHHEFGLLTETRHIVNGKEKFSVYIPGAPVPTAGRLVIVDPGDVERIDFDKKQLVEVLLTFGSTQFSASSKTIDV